MGAALGEVCDATGLPKATAHRVLSALVAERLVERPAGTRLYRLGPELFAFGTSMSSIFDFRDLSSRSLVTVSEASNELVLLGIRSGFDALCLGRVEGKNTPDDVLIQLMDRWPLGIGVFSLALLAYLPEAEIIEILRYNERRLSEKTKYSVDQILPMLSKVRSEGHAFLTLPPLESHARPKAGIAVPIFDPQRRPIASICIIAEDWRLREGSRERLTALLVKEAEDIGRRFARKPENGDSPESWQSAID